MVTRHGRVTHADLLQRILRVVLLGLCIFNADVMPIDEVVEPGLLDFRHRIHGAAVERGGLLLITDRLASKFDRRSFSLQSR